MSKVELEPEINEGCVLLAKSKTLAIKKGFDPELVVCQMINLCDGRTCIYVAPKNVEAEPKVE